MSEPGTIIFLKQLRKKSGCIRMNRVAGEVPAQNILSETGE